MTTLLQTTIGVPHKKSVNFDNSQAMLKLSDEFEIDCTEHFALELKLDANEMSGR